MTAADRGREAIGLMGGTFDPIHLGHLIIAEEAREALSLDRMLFVPAGRPPHKSGGRGDRRRGSGRNGGARDRR